MLGSVYPITDICLTVRDLDRAVAFYRDKLDFRPRRSAPGFADFKADKVTLALWQIGHIEEHVGYRDAGPGPSGHVHKVMVALEVPARADVDRVYQTLLQKGVEFSGPPKEYMWNAYCCYFSDPESNLWEIYAWTGEGADAYHDVHTE